MTLIVGGALSEGIFVAGDSRATVRTERRDEAEYYDDLQKVYYLPPYLVGAAGKVSVCSLLLSGLASALRGLEIEKSLAHEDREQYVRSIVPWFYDLVATGLGEQPAVGLMFSSLSPQTRNQATTAEAEPSRRSVRKTSARLRGVPDESARRGVVDRSAWVLSFEFPSGRIQKGELGSILTLGSGAYIDDVLGQMTCTIHHHDDELFEFVASNDSGTWFDGPAQMDVRSKVLSIATRVLMFHSEHGDPTFNSCIHGFAVEPQGKVYAPGFGAPFKAKGKLRCSTSGIAFAEFGEMSREHRLLRREVDRLLERDPTVGREVEKHTFMGMVETLYRERSFWILDHSHRRAYRMRSMLTDRAEVRAVGDFWLSMRRC